MAKAVNTKQSPFISVRNLVWIALGFAAILYGNTLKNVYNIDDELVTIKHRLTSKGISAIPEIFTNPYYKDEMGYSYEYRPVTLVTFAIEHELFGDNATVSHFINLLLYLLCIFLFILVATKMSGSENIFFLFFSVLLFVAHPLHTEVVASIKNRDELLSLTGGLLAFWLAFKFIDSGSYLYLPMLALTFIGAVLSKMSVFSFVFIVPFWFIITNASGRKIILITLSLLLPSIAALLLRKMEPSQIVFISASLSLLLILIFVSYRTKWSDYISDNAGRLKNLFSYDENNFSAKIDTTDIIVLVITLAVIAYSFITYNFFVLIPVLAVVLITPYFKARHSIIDFFLPGLLIAFLSAFLETKHIEWFYYFFLATLFLKTNFNKTYSLISYVTFALFFGVSYYFKSGELPEADRVIIPLFFVGVDFALGKFNVKKKITVAVWSGIILLMLLLSFLVGELDFAPVVFPFAALLLQFAGKKILPRTFALAIVIFFALAVYNIPSPFVKIRFKAKAKTETQAVNESSQTQAESVSTVPRSINTQSTIPGNGVDRPLDFVEFPLGFSPTFSEKFGTISYVLGYYLKMMFVPYPMCYYYGYNKIKIVNLSNIWVLLSIIAHLVLLFSAIFFIRKYPFYGIGVLAYLSSIFLFSNLVSPVAGMIGDRLAFVASFGFCIAGGYALSHLYERATAQNRKIITVGFSFVLVVYSGITIARNAQWKDHMTLYKHDIKYLEESAQAHNLLAKRLLLESFQQRSSEKQYQMRLEGVKHYEKAIAIYPEFFNPHIDLGKAYLLVNRLDDAARIYLKAAKMDTTYYDSWFQAGGIFVQLQKYPEAIICFEKVISKDSSYLQAYNSLSEVYFRQKNYEKAIDINLRAIELFPGNYDPVVNTGKTYFTMGDKANALIYFEKAYLINPNDRNLILAIAGIYKDFGDKEKSDYYFLKAQQISR